MKPSWTKFLLILAVAFLLLGAAACTQSKPSVPTATLAPLNATPLLPATTSDTPSATEGTPVGPAGTVPASPSDATPLPTPTSAFGSVPTPLLPAPIPQPTVASNPPSEPPATAGGSGGACTNPYTVQRGEWLYSIARKCGVAPGALIAANPGINPNLIVQGMRLNMPGGGATSGGGAPSGSGRTYVVQAGDTLFSIATRFGTTVAALMQANGITDPNFIYPGRVLNIP